MPAGRRLTHELLWRFVRVALSVGLAFGITLDRLAGQSADAMPDDPMSAPTEYGFTLTPDLAKSMASMYVQEYMVEHLEMDESKKDEAVEKAARRMMELAHKLDGDGHMLIERFVEEQMDSDHQSFIPKGFRKEFGERLLPMMPEIRQFWTDMNRDLRPMLTFKQQMKMAGELTAINTGFEMFEERMKKWAAGEAESDNPFDFDSNEPEVEQVELNEEGISDHLVSARNTANSSVLDMQSNEWSRYLDQFRAFYELDDAQFASAEALMRRHLELLDQNLRDPDWKARYYRNRLWTMMLNRLDRHWEHPLNHILTAEYETLMREVAAHRNAFKLELLQIPTQAQQQAAMQRMRDLLVERGIFQPDEELEYPDVTQQEPEEVAADVQ